MYKNGRLFGLINIIDLLIVLVLAAAAVIIAPNFIGGKSPIAAISAGVAKNTTVYFTVELLQSTMDVADKISIGDAIKDNTRGYYYGTVDEFEVVPSSYYAEDVENGKYILTDKPDKINILLTLKCNGTEDDREITAEGQPIKIGKHMVLKGKGYVGAGYVVGIKTVEEARQ